MTIWATEADARATVTASTTQSVMDRFGEVVEGPPTFENYEVSSDY